MYLNIILIILLIAVLSWREVQILIDRGSWKAEDYRRLFWYIDWKSKWKNFDSFHVSNGVMTLILCIILRINIDYDVFYLFCDTLTHIAHIIAYWLIWMQLRNFFMHVVYRRKNGNQKP